MREKENEVIFDIDGLKAGGSRFERSNVAAIQVWLRAGASFDPEERLGVAHLLEHMVFLHHDENTKEKIAQTIESMGGLVNGWTSHDFMVFHAMVPKEFLEDALFFLLKAIFNLKIEEQALEQERGVVLQEIAREQENFANLCLKLALEARFKGHPYGRRVLGTKGTVERISTTDLIAFHTSRFTTQNSAVYVASNHDPREIERTIRKVLEHVHIRKGHDSCNLPFVRTASNKGEVFCVKAPSKETYFSVAYPGSSLTSKRTPAMDAFSAILGEVSGSILERWRLEKGLVNTIYSHSHTALLGGALIVAGSTAPEKARDAIHSLFSCLEEAFEKRISEAELGMVLEESYASFLRLEETAQGIASRRAYELLIGKPNFFSAYLRKLASLRSADIKDLAQSALQKTKPVVAVLGKEGIAEKQSLSLCRPLITKAPEKPRITTFEVDGCTILHYPDKSHPTAAAVLDFRGGLERETQETNGVHALLARLWLCGAGGQDARFIRKQFSGLAASVDARAGMSYVSASLDAPVKNFLVAMSLLSRCILEPNLAEQDLRREADYLCEAVRSRADNPVSLLLREAVASLFPNDPYGLDPAGNPAFLQRVTRQDVAQALTALLDRASLTIALVGDVDALETVGFFPSLIPSKKGPAAPSNAITVSGTTIEKRGAFSQSHVAIIWKGVSKYERKRLSLNVFATTLDMMSGPLFGYLRDTAGIAYSFGASNVSLNRGGYFLVRASVRSGEEEKALSLIRRAIDELLEVPDKGRTYLTVGKRALAGSYAVSFQKKIAIASFMAQNHSTFLGADGFLGIQETILGLKEDDIREDVREVLESEPNIVILRPQEAEKAR